MLLHECCVTTHGVPVCPAFWRGFLLSARAPTSGSNPERSGIMYNLNVWNIGYEVLCAGRQEGAGISQELWGG